MMPSRARLAETVSRAFDMAGDLIHPAVLTRAEPGAYDPATGRPTAPLVRECRGRALPDRKPKTAFTDLMVKPGQLAVWLTSLSFAPREGDSIAIDGETRIIRFAEELPGALFLVVAE
ncbi:MAG: hypothetical protein K2Q10_03960 [Rhodospirillales bacterium]|nr:hypothetical protein [Rhodospirillales bacterium]